MITNYKDVLEKDGILAQLPVGFSMYPMLRQHVDTVVIERIKEKPKKNDVVFYLKDNGKYVLHRIIKIKNGEYIIRGDNCYYTEYDITDKHILGILTGFYRGDKYINCKSNKKYKLYVFFRTKSYPIRKGFVSVRSFLSKIKHKIFK